MSDHAPMTPEQARDDLEYLNDFEVGDVYDTARHALQTLAAMAEEVEYRIVDPDTNGGRYELRRWSRHVTEWSTDE